RRLHRVEERAQRRARPRRVMPHREDRAFAQPCELRSHRAPSAQPAFTCCRADATSSFHGPGRPLAAVPTYSRSTFTSSAFPLAIAPTSERVTSSAVTFPPPKLCARIPLLKSTLIASAVDRTALGVLSLVLPSLVTPARSSWNSVTSIRAISAGG